MSSLSIIPPCTLLLERMTRNPLVDLRILERDFWSSEMAIVSNIRTFYSKFSKNSIVNLWKIYPSTQLRLLQPNGLRVKLASPGKYVCDTLDLLNELFLDLSRVYLQSAVAHECNHEQNGEGDKEFLLPDFHAHHAKDNNGECRDEEPSAESDHAGGKENLAPVFEGFAWCACDLCEEIGGDDHRFRLPFLHEPLHFALEREPDECAERNSCLPLNNRLLSGRSFNVHFHISCLLHTFADFGGEGHGGSIVDLFLIFNDGCMFLAFLIFAIPPPY